MGYVTIEYLRECFSYDPLTGDICWRERPLSHFHDLRSRNSANQLRAGKPVRNTSTRGYVYIRLNYQGESISLMGHRVAWAIHYGVWANDMIDHINRVKTDNRICNLREATPSQNARNSGPRPSNKFGLKGVSRWNHRYRAQICVNGKVRYIGMFDTPEQAHEAYCAASDAAEQQAHRDRASKRLKHARAL